MSVGACLWVLAMSNSAYAHGFEKLSRGTILSGAATAFGLAGPDGLGFGAGGRLDLVHYFQRDGAFFGAGVYVHYINHIETPRVDGGLSLRTGYDFLLFEAGFGLESGGPEGSGPNPVLRLRSGVWFPNMAAVTLGFHYARGHPSIELAVALGFGTRV